jgi:serine/threonine protein kinase
MPLTVGENIGPYQILAPIGAGGMGEVYKARDTKLDRDVAIKVLPAALAQDSERLARFEREAKVLASLNHPNIAQIYGVEESGGVRALVMELVPGHTLKGPIPLNEALRLAAQIAEALGAAHEKGVTHRDLKPLNVMITPEGLVKVLDFGLAAVTQPAATHEGDPSQSPTVTISPTRAGMILGTAAYMSPEQVRGQNVDRRSDIWAFGALLYEILTGRPLFRGETISDILASVLKEEPSLEQVPARVRPLLRRCLEREPKKRLQAIGDWQLLIVEEAALSSPIRTRQALPLPWIATAVLAIAAAGLGFLSYRHATEGSPQVMKVSLLPPEDTVFSAQTQPLISPDGRHVAFVATANAKRGVSRGQQLWIRDLDSLTARPLPGTENAAYLFWSPDSRSIAYSSNVGLMRVNIDGGPPVPFPTFVGASRMRAGSWGEDTIVFQPSTAGGLTALSVEGGNTRPITVLDTAKGEYAHVYPWFLPDGRHFLYTALHSGGKEGTVYLADTNSSDHRAVLSAGANIEYAAPGYIVYLRERTLLAQAFDVRKAVTTGDPVPIAEPVGYMETQAQGLYSVSRNGILVYSGGSTSSRQQLTWFDRTGKELGTIGPPGNGIQFPKISPDGRIIAVDRQDTKTGIIGVWLHDLQRNTESRISPGSDITRYPIWLPDGNHIVFFSPPSEGSILLTELNGSGRQTVLDTGKSGGTTGLRAVAISADGRYLFEERIDPKTNNDIWVLPLSENGLAGKAYVLVRSVGVEQYPAPSPSGPWLAYASDENGRREVYVQRFPQSDGKWQISTDGGDKPVWSRDGKELFFLAPDGKMMAAEIKPGQKFEASIPKTLFDPHIMPNAWFDVSKDGRFLIPVLTEQSASAPMTVVLNWQAGLKK